MDTLTIREMKSLLKRRKVSLTGLLEKKEIADRVKNSLPQLSPAGQWTGKWRASYIVAEKDAKRCKITKDEIVNTEWKFRYALAKLHAFVEISTVLRRHIDTGLGIGRMGNM